MGVGWKIDPETRATLLARLPPRWPDVIADHVTLWRGQEAALLEPKEAEIVGHVDDNAGLQALVVRVDGTTDRPDGSIYHITWSLDQARGRTAIQSNIVLAERGWAPLDTAIPIRLHPARWVWPPASPHAQS